MFGEYITNWCGMKDESEWCACLCVAKCVCVCVSSLSLRSNIASAAECLYYNGGAAVEAAELRESL